LKIPKFKNIQIKFIVAVEEGGGGVKLGKDDRPISSRQRIQISFKKYYRITAGSISIMDIILVCLGLNDCQPPIPLITKHVPSNFIKSNDSAIHFSLKQRKINNMQPIFILTYMPICNMFWTE